MQYEMCYIIYNAILNMLYYHYIWMQLFQSFCQIIYVQLAQFFFFGSGWL